MEHEQPDFMAYYAGGGAAGYPSSANGGRGIDELGGERSMRNRARVSIGSASLEIDEEDASEENMDVGDGSTMDIEED